MKIIYFVLLFLLVGCATFPVHGDYVCTGGETGKTKSRACSEVSCIANSGYSGKDLDKALSKCDLSFPEDYTSGGPQYQVGRD